MNTPSSMPFTTARQAAKSSRSRQSWAYSRLPTQKYQRRAVIALDVNGQHRQQHMHRQRQQIGRLVHPAAHMVQMQEMCIRDRYPSAQLLFRLFSSDDAVVAQGVQMMHYLVPVYKMCIRDRHWPLPLRAARR